MFEKIAGLPAHPLFVHLPVVALPVAGLLAFAWAVWEKRRREIGLPALVVATAALVGVFAARWSGESLLETLGLSEEQPGPVGQHADLADYATYAAIALFVLVLVWFVLSRERFAGNAQIGIALMALRVLAVIVSVATIVVTVLVGHAGAQLAWGDNDLPSSTTSTTTSK